MASWCEISTLIVELASSRRYFTDKKLLASYSNYFARLFQDGCYDVDTNTIALWDVSYEEFKVMVQIFQNIKDGNHNGAGITAENILELLGLANRFESATLSRCCVIFIKQNLKEMDKFKCLEQALQTKCEELKIVLEQYFAEALDQEETATTKSFLTENKLIISRMSLSAQSFILKVVMEADGRNSIRLKFERSQKEGLDKRITDLRKTCEQKTKELEEARKSLNQLKEVLVELKDSVKISKEKVVSAEKEFATKLEEEKSYRNVLQNRVLDLLSENQRLQEKQKDVENLLFQLEFEQALAGKSNAKFRKLNKIWDASLNAKEVDLLLFDEEPEPSSAELEINKEKLIDLDDFKLSTIMYKEDLQLFDFAAFYPPESKEKSKEISDWFRSLRDDVNIV